MICPSCNNEIADYYLICPKCKHDFKNLPEINVSSFSNNKSKNQAPAICSVLVIIAIINFTCGFLASIYYLGQQMFISAIVYIIAGLITSVMFWALSEIINYLDVIAAKK